MIRKYSEKWMVRLLFLSLFSLSVVSPRGAHAEEGCRWVFYGVGSGLAVIEGLTAYWASQNRGLLEQLNDSISKELTTLPPPAPAILSELNQLAENSHKIAGLDLGVLICSSASAAGAFFSGSAFYTLLVGGRSREQKLDYENVGGCSLLVTVPLLVFPGLPQLVTSWIAWSWLAEAKNSLSDALPAEVADKLQEAVKQGRYIPLVPTLLNGIGILSGLCLFC